MTVELVEGAGYRFWPRPGRVFAAARTHSFAQLATAIDVSFGRWDLDQLWQFELAGHVYVAPEDPEWQSAESDKFLDGNSRLSRLAVGDEFVYQFDPNDSWLHICRVAEGRIDPARGDRRGAAGADRLRRLGHPARPVPASLRRRRR